MKIANVKGILNAFDEASKTIIGNGAEIELNKLRNLVFDAIVSEEAEWEAERQHFLQVIGDR